MGFLVFILCGCLMAFGFGFLGVFIVVMLPQNQYFNLSLLNVFEFRSSQFACVLGF